MRVVDVVVLTLCMLVGVVGEGLASSGTGRLLYTGELGQLGQTDQPEGAATLKRFPCHSCHGRDALGGREGDVPAVEWSHLSRPQDGRGAYSLASFHRAVTTGETDDGQSLSRLMPRYALSAAETASLRDYLETIHTLQRRGVEVDRLLIGVVDIGADSELSTLYQQVLSQALSARLGGNLVHGRRVELIAVNPATTVLRQELLAVVATPIMLVDRYSAEGIPTIAPLGALRGDEDPSIVRSITPSRQVRRQRLAEELVTQAESTVTIIAVEPEAAAAQALALRLIDPAFESRVRTDLSGVDGGGDIVLMGDAPMPKQAQLIDRVWLEWQQLAHLPSLPAAPSVIAVLDTPRIVDEAIRQQRHPALIHASITGSVLAEALKVAGRDLTRSRIMQAFDTLVLTDMELNYERYPLTGTAEVRFVRLRGDPLH